MENVFEFGTTARHGDILDFLTISVGDLLKREELRKFSESASLSYYGDIKDLTLCRLIDVNEIQDPTLFLEDVINHLNFITPDYIHFKNNKYLINQIGTKLVGYPDLIIEIWSKSNYPADRQFKKFLYSTGDTTEHWYIEQDSNTIECWYGKERLEDKNMSDILVSRDGIEFDLRHWKL